MYVSACRVGGRVRAKVGSNKGGLTGIELLAIGLQSAPIMDLDLIPLLRLAFAFHGERDIDLQVIRGQGANRSRGEERKREQEGSHLRVGQGVSWGEVADTCNKGADEKFEAVLSRGLGNFFPASLTGKGNNRGQAIWPDQPRTMDVMAGASRPATSATLGGLRHVPPPNSVPGTIPFAEGTLHGGYQLFCAKLGQCLSPYLSSSS